MLAGFAALFAVGHGVIKISEWSIKRWRRNEYKELIPIWSPQIQSFKDFLEKMRGETVWFDAVIDFSIWNETSHKIWEVCKDEFKGDALGEELHRCRIPIIRSQDNDNYIWIDSFVIVMSDPTKFAPSSGGTSITHVFLRGYFEVETCFHSGPSVEYTLRETDRPHNW